LPKIHDEIRRQTIIYNDNYKFDVYLYSILQEFVIENMVMVKIHSERLSLETMSQLHTRRICLSRVPRKITSITDELDIP